jgi:hypothetical protein
MIRVEFRLATYSEQETYEPTFSMKKTAIKGTRRGFRWFQRPLELPLSAKAAVTVELQGQVNKMLKMRPMGQ